MNPLIFREYDIRGHAERDLTDETARLIGQAFGTYIQQHGSDQVLVGRDNRLSSQRLRDALTGGLTAAGCRVIDLGVVITPMVYYARVFFNVDGAVMITGSHNPPEENGFKLACGDGTIYGKEIQRLQEMIQSGQLAGAHPAGNPSGRVGAVGRGQGRRQERSITSPYLAMLKEKIVLGPRRLKVVADCGNGTASLFAVDILQSWGCEVVPLYCDSDGLFPHHHPDPVKTANLADLRRTVQQQSADVGVAFDGDADRIGVVDGQEQVIWGDKLMCLYWREVLERYPHSLAIIEVKCSQALVDEVTRLGGRPMFYKTGHSLIKAKMKETGAVFTGEMSGHMFFADEYYGYDDALYAAGRLLRILSHTELTLAQLLEHIPRYYATAETRIPCPDQVKFPIVRNLVDHFRRTYQVVDVDGARVLFPEGWGLVRASNTQPVLVARCEAKTGEGLEQICKVMKQAIMQFPEVGAFEWEF